jgi:UDP-N-acetylglucosamine 2-epimerase (non-hydrolysing)
LGLMPYSQDSMAKYYLADIHRSENINNVDRLLSIFNAFNMIAEELHTLVLCSIHPKTKDMLSKIEYKKHESVILLDSFGYFDFVRLEQNTSVGLTDSGLCSEEYCILQVPCVIIRNETERPEVVESGGAIISGTNAESILKSVKIMDTLNRHWNIPNGYNDLNVSDKVVNYILGKNQ